MTRRTSVYELSVIPTSAVAGVTLHAQLDLMLARFPLADVQLAGSGVARDAFFIRFRIGSDVAAQELCAFLTQHTRSKSRTLSTGMGVNHRFISLEGYDMATKYDVQLDDGTSAGVRARKDAAIKLGDESGAGYRVVATNSGTVVHQVDAPAPAFTTEEEPTVATSTDTAPAPTTEESGPSRDVTFHGLSKSFAKEAGLYGANAVGKVHGVTATAKGAVITLHGADEDTAEVAAHLNVLWPAAKLPYREWKKTDSTYAPLDKSQKNKEAAAQRRQLEGGYFITFMDGAADALAGSPKRKGGAYKDGVTAVNTPADDTDGVI